MDLAELYHYLIVEVSIPRTREWPFVSSPYPLLLITIGYIYFILYAGPRYMKNRPPYKLRTFILIYNMIQILANLWFVKEHLSAGWFSEISIICGPPNPISPNSIKVYFRKGEPPIFLSIGILLYFDALITNMIVKITDKIIFKVFNIAWWLIFLKLFDYVETCVFVLRKKQNQVSALHVYHHVSNVTFLWYFLKYVLDERGTIITLCNCAVHVIMYIYYFMAAWSPELQQIISPIKPLITKLQMVQFIVLIIVLLQFLSPTCELPVEGLRIAPIFILNLLIFLYLFYDFYKKNYTKLPKQKNN